MIKDLLKKIANAVTINGERYENVRSVKVNKNRVYVNGDMVGRSTHTGILSIQIEGVLQNLECDGDVTCGDIAGSVNANGDVTCRDIKGTLSANGDVTCGRVTGGVTCSGDFTSSL